MAKAPCVRATIGDSAYGGRRRMQRSFLTTSEAAAYCGLSISGLHSARRRGRVCPSGRRGGGRGAWMWSIAELDRFLLGHDYAVHTAQAQEFSESGESTQATEPYEPGPTYSEANERAQRCASIPRSGISSRRARIGCTGVAMPAVNRDRTGRRARECVQDAILRIRGVASQNNS